MGHVAHMGDTKCTYIYIYTGCPGGNVPDFGRMFLKLSIPI